MQTFLPYPSFVESLECLDPKRLGNQIYREALTLARGGWPNHPVSKQWKGHEYWLCHYALIGLEVLQSRGLYYPKWIDEFHSIQSQYPKGEYPKWMGIEEYHSSHRAALLFKDPDWYSQFNWKEEPKIEYWWPSHHQGG